MKIPDLRINDFDYNLPTGRIAQYPLEDRDASKLLVWKDGKISENIFSNIGEELPPGCLLVFNDTKIIRARLIFTKPTGAVVEIFCLEPLSPVTEINAAISQTGSCTWNCLIGNVKRWKEGLLEKNIIHEGTLVTITAEKKENLGEGCFAIEFRWEPEMIPFSDILEYAGVVPLPPYIERESGSIDVVRYQTIYAKNQGSVAAPTAGLHFTNRLMEKLRGKKISFEHVTLHVGLGTFRPVTMERLADHVMHGERISVSLSTIKDLIKYKEKPVIAVGTTSVRTLESLYWMGIKMITGNHGIGGEVSQWDPYDERYNLNIPFPQALGALVSYLDHHEIESYEGFTRLMIVPGYKFRVISGMITNFHIPKSTLLMLVAAFTKEGWKTAYEYALVHEFRFLSYGDACLFY